MIDLPTLQEMMENPEAGRQKMIRTYRRMLRENLAMIVSELLIVMLFTYWLIYSLIHHGWTWHLAMYALVVWLSAWAFSHASAHRSTLKDRLFELDSRPFRR